MKLIEGIADQSCLRALIPQGITSGPGSSSGSGPSQVILYLRKRTEVLQTELQLAEQSAARLRSEAAIAKRAAEQASAQLSSQLEQSRQALRTESDHQASMAQQEQINLLRESNQKFRCVPPDRSPHLETVVVTCTDVGEADLSVWAVRMSTNNNEY